MKLGTHTYNPIIYNVRLKKSWDIAMTNKIGRPSDYTQDLADIVCERLALGESMRSISRDTKMPAMTTLFRWLREKEEFQQQYAIAKQESAEAHSEDCLDISDNIDGNPVIVDGVPLVVNGEIVRVIDNTSIQHARLKVDTRKWLMSKMKPKKYGDRITTEHTGSIGLADLTNEELAAKTRELEQALKQSTQD